MMAPGPTKVSKVDVLIIGAGPAGLMAATWMARCGIRTRVIEKKGGRILCGQADGLQCRSLEILDSFNLADGIWKESNHLLEICLWNPDDGGCIRRSDRIPDTIPGLCRFQQVVLHQGQIEAFFLDSLEKYGVSVERGVLPVSLSVDGALVGDGEAYPVEVGLGCVEEGEVGGVSDGSGLVVDGTERVGRNERARTREVVRAKYVIGCDGAHSWTRRQLGFVLEGEQTDYIWGVLDIIPITDFPDIRMRCAIHSANSGSVMIIPRENKLVRLYIQMTTTEKGDAAKLDRTNITPQMILQCAQKTIAPYKLTYKYCDWWTAYQIGQRISPSFSASERIFLAGDAVHTHSPKAGQGMNISMQDTYNLGWKIASVLNGVAKRSILKTYQSERRRVAQDLIAFDHKFSRLFSGRPARDVADEEGISMEEFKDVFVKGNLFASGVAVDYGASCLVAKQGDSREQGDGSPVEVTTLENGERLVGNPELAKNIKVGMRIPSFQVLNQADARPWQLQQHLKSDGRFRIVVFAGKVKGSEQMRRVRRLGDSLSSPESFVRKVTPFGKPFDSVIDVLAIHSSPRTEVEFFDFPELFRPFDEETGWDYSKIFVDDVSYHEGHGKAYEGYGVGPEGCLVVLRPDQHVGFVGELEDVKGVERYFGEFMVNM